jgi:hypothetical protein
MNYRHVCAAAFWISMACGCGLNPKPVTIKGPETDSLLAAARGFIVMDRPPGGIMAVQLPTLRAIIVRPESSRNSPDMADIHALSGPDNLGRIAYVEDHFFVENEKNRRHLLKTIRLDGTQDTALFTRPGDAMWADSAAGHGEIGHTLSLAPTGGRVAFLSGLEDVQMPSALLMRGSIEIWNIDQKTGIKTDLRALDEGLSWFPDGKRLAYVKLIDRNGNPAVNDPAEAVANSFLVWNWDRIPAVFIHDVESQTETFVHTGWKPIVSVDGTRVLVGDRNNTFYCVELATGKTCPLTGPGKDWPIAMLDANTLLAICIPTVGTEVKFTEFYSPLSRPKQMLAVKLARTDLQAFQTVIPYIDPRAEVSFGLGRQNTEGRHQ